MMCLEYEESRIATWRDEIPAARHGLVRFEEERGEMKKKKSDREKATEHRTPLGRSPTTRQLGMDGTRSVDGADLRDPGQA